MQERTPDTGADGLSGLDRLARLAAHVADASAARVEVTLDDGERRAASVGDVDGPGATIAVPAHGPGGERIGSVIVAGPAGARWNDAQVAALDDVAGLLAACPRAAMTEPAGPDLRGRLLDPQQLRSALRRELTRRSATPAVIVVYVDDLWRIDDAHGRTAGDAVLARLALRLRAEMRESDEIARWGGAELAVLAVDVDDQEAAMRVAAKIREVLAIPPLGEAAADPLRMSIGVARARPGARSHSAVLREAERALAEAESRGSDQTVAAWDLPPAHPPVDAALEEVALDLVRRAVGGDPARLERARGAAMLSGLVAVRAGLDPATAARARLAGLALGLDPGAAGSASPSEAARHAAAVMRGSERLGDVAEIALHRHERWDGSGAPDRLAGERIPPEARVVACVDAFLSVREVSTGDAESMRLVESLAGTVLDPALPEVLGEILAAEARPAAA